MLENTGWIKLHRKLNKWEWKDKPFTLALFIHLLINASHKDSKWRGVSIPAGSCLTGRKKLSQATGLSERQVRTALTHLISTNEVTIKATKEYSIVSIVKWNSYQQTDQQNANERPSTDQAPTTYKNVKNTKNVKEERSSHAAPMCPDDVSQSIWEDHLKNRKAKRQPITDTALEGMRREAEKAGFTLEQALTEACQRGWASFKAEWVTKETKLNGKSKLATEADALLERIRSGATSQSSNCFD